MTERRMAILLYVQSYELATGRTPGVREIAAALDMRGDTVTHNLKMLRNLGYIKLVRLPSFAWHIESYRFPGQPAIVTERSAS